MAKSIAKSKSNWNLDLLEWHSNISLQFLLAEDFKKNS